MALWPGNNHVTTRDIANKKEVVASDLKSVDLINESWQRRRLCTSWLVSENNRYAKTRVTTLKKARATWKDTAKSKANYLLCSSSPQLPSQIIPSTHTPDLDPSCGRKPNSSSWPLNVPARWGVSCLHIFDSIRKAIAVRSSTKK